MRAMHVLPARNLNQLVALHALLETRSVTQAARRIGITQSAMSHALARLRAELCDPLFTRGAQGLTATPFCLGIAPRVFGAIGEIEAVFSARHAFDRARTTRTLRLATSEPALLDAGRLLARLRTEAPGLRLTITRPGDDVDERLATGRLDLALGGPHERPRGAVHHETLLRDRFVALVAARTARSKTRWSARRYADAEHVVVARDERPTFVDEALRALGLRRRVALVVPDFACVAEAVQSGLVATVPALVAARLSPLRSVPLALALPPFEARAYWHARAEGDPAVRWLRDTLKALVVDRPHHVGISRPSRAR